METVWYCSYDDSIFIVKLHKDSSLKYEIQMDTNKSFWSNNNWDSDWMSKTDIFFNLGEL